jgi:hypothetical protein
LRRCASTAGPRARASKARSRRRASRRRPRGSAARALTQLIGLLSHFCRHRSAAPADAAAVAAAFAAWPPPPADAGYCAWLVFAVRDFADHSPGGFALMAARGLFPAVLPPLESVAGDAGAAASWFVCFYHARDALAPEAVPWRAALACAADGPGAAALWALRLLRRCLPRLPPEERLALLAPERVLPICRRVAARGPAQAVADAIALLAHRVAYEDCGARAALFGEEFLDALFDYLIVGDNQETREAAAGVVGKLAEAGRAIGDDRFERRMEEVGFVEELCEAAEGDAGESERVILLEYLRG